MGLSAGDITAALDALSVELAGSGQRAELVIVGGAAMALLFSARQTTKDVDVCVLRPEAAAVRSAAAKVASRLSLPDDWLNDGAKGYLVGVTEGRVLYESSSLVAKAPSNAQLLAMKLAAWRDAIDRDDARILLKSIPGTAEEVWLTVKSRVPAPLLDKASYAFQDLWESVHGTP
ncbi:MAG: nucleotidyl transferase [Phycisphaerae bacterium]|nr:nucleotidyl transferase [Phycisphaerae bacterium]